MTSHQAVNKVCKTGSRAELNVFICILIRDQNPPPSAHSGAMCWQTSTGTPAAVVPVVMKRPMHQTGPETVTFPAASATPDTAVSVFITGKQTPEGWQV